MGGKGNNIHKNYYWGDVRGSVYLAAIYQGVGLFQTVDSL